MEESNNIVITGGEYNSFRYDVLKRIRSAQYEAMRAVNKEMISLYFILVSQRMIPKYKLLFHPIEYAQEINARSSSHQHR